MLLLIHGLRWMAVQSKRRWAQGMEKWLHTTACILVQLISVDKIGPCAKWHNKSQASCGSVCLALVPNDRWIHVSTVHENLLSSISKSLNSSVLWLQCKMVCKIYGWRLILNTVHTRVEFDALAFIVWYHFEFYPEAMKYFQSWWSSGLLIQPSLSGLCVNAMSFV